MYAREVKDRTITLAVSGMLWNRSLVMIDSETDSLWSHLLGEAMQGELKGAQLELLPSLMTDWGTWRKLHPHSTVVMLKRTSSRFNREFYKKSGRRFVLGDADGEDAVAWPYEALEKQPALNDQLNDVPLLVVFDSPSSTAFLYDRRLADRTLSFAMRDGKLLDDETKSVWDALTGQATAGPLKGQQLKPLAGVVSFRRAWTIFHPSTRLWEAK